jgi:hypothetical protein
VQYQTGLAAGNIPTPAPITNPNIAILSQISLLEASQARPLREAALGIAGASARLVTLNNQIMNLRLQLT